MERLRNDETQDGARPISPHEALELKQANIPDVVINTVNRLIAENIRYGYATLYQKDIVKELVASGLNRREIFDKHWLDFEDMYREAGWEVTYDSPGFNETYDETFKFEAPECARRLGSVATRQCTCRSSQ